MGLCQEGLEIYRIKHGLTCCGDPGEEACRVKDAAFGVLEVSLSTARSDLKVNFLRRPLLERLTHCVHMSVRCNIFQVTKYSTV